MGPITMSSVRIVRRSTATWDSGNDLGRKFPLLRRRSLAAVTSFSLPLIVYRQ